MEEELQGYRGRTREALEAAGVKVGDLIRVARRGFAYEGVLMPRSELGSAEHVVIKLRSGYNVGVRLNEEATVEFLAEGEKPAFISQPPPSSAPQLPKVSIISTGGTIASRVDYRTGAVRPALSAEDLYSIVPEISAIAQIKAEILLSLHSENIEPRHWTQMAIAVGDHIKNGADGVVVAHGTDTMGYTAAALSFALRGLPVPVILVGSQRSSDRPSSDAALNLISAVAAAAHAPFAEVAVAMHEDPSDRAVVLHRGTKVRKCHTSRRDAFKTVNAQPLGRVADLKVSMNPTQRYRPRGGEGEFQVRPDFDDRVALFKYHPGLRGELISWVVDRGFRGIVLEGTGLGHVNRSLLPAVREAIARGVLVAMTSQCIWGEVRMTVYEAGRDLLEAGVIPLGDMLPETALVKMMWALGQTKDADEAKGIIEFNLAGEFSPRLVPD